MFENGWVKTETRNQPMAILCDACDDRDSRVLWGFTAGQKRHLERALLLGGLESYVGAKAAQTFTK